MRVKVVFERAGVEDKLALTLERVEPELGGEWLLFRDSGSVGLEVVEIDGFKTGLVMLLDGRLGRGKVALKGINVGDALVLIFELTGTMLESVCLLKGCTETGELKVESPALVRLDGTRLAYGAPVPVPGGSIGGRDALPEALGN